MASSPRSRSCANFTSVSPNHSSAMINASRSTDATTNRSTSHGERATVAAGGSSTTGTAMASPIDGGA